MIEGIPVMLLEEKMSSLPEIAEVDIDVIETETAKGVTSDNKYNPPGQYRLDPFVQKMIGATCGIMYQCMVDRLKRYPIPNIPLPKVDGLRFLDLGCNWGRWCIGAANLGYKPVGIDRNLQAVMAARRVAGQLGIEANYLVADVRYLPFQQEVFDLVFSYSVLQHISKEDVQLCLLGVRRTLKNNGVALIQLPNILGLLSLFYQIKRRFRQPRGFEVHYWWAGELEKVFTRLIGQTSISVDGFFSLNAQDSNSEMLPFYFRFLVNCSLFLRRTSKKIPWLKYIADSLYVRSVKVSTQA